MLELFVLSISTSLYSQGEFQFKIPSYEPESVIDKIKADVKNDLNIVDLENIEITIIDDVEP